MMASTALFVLSSIGVGLFAVMAAAKRLKEKRSGDAATAQHALKKICLRLPIIL